MLPRVKRLDWRGKSVSGGVTSVVGTVVVLTENPNRVGATIVNDGTTVKYLSKGLTAAVNTGIPLVQYGSYEINLTDPWQGAVSVACSAAGEKIAFTEDE